MSNLKITIQGTDRIGIINDIIVKLRKRDIAIASLDFMADGQQFRGGILCSNPRKVSESKLVSILRSIKSVEIVKFSI